MSDEPEVTPLRLKRPGAGGTPPPAVPPSGPAPVPQAPAPASNPDADSPLMPLPGMPASSATIPPTPAVPPAPERIRRRPSLGVETTAAPAVPGPAPGSSGEADPAAEPKPAPLPFASSVPTQPPPSPPAGGGFKLKIGSKPAAPPPPAVIPGEAPPPSLFVPPGADPAGAPPLIPLPGMPGGVGGGGFPPPPAGMGSEAGAPPVPPLAPLPSAPVMTAGVPGSTSGSGTRPPIHLRADAPAAELDPVKLPPPLPAARARAAVAGASSARRDALIFAAVFLVIAAIGGGAWFFFARPGEAKDAIGGVREKLEEAAKLPGKAVDDARQSMAGAREKEQARVDAVVEGEETPTERAIGAVSPGELQNKLQEANSGAPVEPPAETTARAEPQAVTAYAGDKPADPVAPPPPPKADPRFVRYAEGLRVSGVFQGSPARALVDGRLVRSGEMIEPNLGVTFVGVDAETKHLILQDKAGAQVRVRY